VQTSTATCPAGSISIGGGYVLGTVDDVTAYARRGPAATQFTVIAVNYYSAGSYVQASVTCAAGQGVSSFMARGSGADAIAAKVAELRDSIPK